MRNALVLFVLLAFGSVVTAQQLHLYATCDVGRETCSVSPNQRPSDARGWFADEVEQTGWGRLYIESNYTLNDSAQSFAAGYVEGYLTQLRIYQEYVNFKQVMFNDTGMTVPPQVYQYVNDQIQYFAVQAEAHPNDPFWSQVTSLQIQAQGIWRGYSAVAPTSQQLSFLDVFLLHYAGDIEDIIPAVVPGMRPDFDAMSTAELAAYTAKRGHCSALVKLTPDLSDLFIGHTTWFSYASMLRVIKRYVMPLQNAKGSLQSGYFGMLQSNDDFYINSAGLAVTETTNDLLNATLWDLVTPKSVPTWMRSVLATRLSNTGQQWTYWFSQYQSGTYNNQWMILDTKQFTPQQPLRPGLLYILEQIPGQIELTDMTHHLATSSFWSSFNRPYFPDMYVTTGYAQYAAQHGNIFSFDMNPRVCQFRRGQGEIETLSDFQHMLLFNEWQTDPYSAGNPGSAIASRFDLVTTPEPIDWLQRGAHGSTDCKVASVADIRQNTLRAICGPTHDTQKPFQWTEEWAAWSHVGQPETFDFDWVTYKLMPSS